METTPLFDPKVHKRPMRVAAFMSGSGTNIKKLLELEQSLDEQAEGSPFNVVFIFSDRSDGACRGERLALDAGIPYFSYDIRQFHKRKGKKRSVATPEGMEARKEFDALAGKLVKSFEVDAIALGGYMSYITLNRCVNVHPADLTVKNPDGSRRFVGDHAVRDAILADETELRSSTLWTDEGVDTGPLMLVSKALQVELPVSLDELRNDASLLEKVTDDHQEKLKEVGDWDVFPKTILWLSQGRFSVDSEGALFVDGQAIPDGVKVGNTD